MKILTVLFALPFLAAADVLPPNVMVFTWDDGPAFCVLFGQCETLLIGAALTEQGAVGLFCQHTCRFADEGLMVPQFADSICTLPVKQPISFDDGLIKGGHGICNHTKNHPTLTAHEHDAALFPVQIGDTVFQLDRIQAEFASAQVLLENHNLQPDGVHAKRAPGLATDDAVDGMLRAFPYTARLGGFLGMDVQGAGYRYGGIVISGDTEWYARGLSPIDFADFMADEILAKCVGGSSGCVALNHDNQDGTLWGYQVYQQLAARLGFDKPGSPIIRDDVTALPGMLGNTRLADARQFSAEFGADDGIGAVVLGDIDGDGIADACKARAAQSGGGIQISCGITAADHDGNPTLGLATPWFAMSDGAWIAAVSHFWLTNIYGQKRADLVYALAAPFAASGTVSVFAARSNGSGFDPPELMLTITVPAAADPARLIQTIRFGHFFSPRGQSSVGSPGPSDLFFSAAGSYFVARDGRAFLGRGFSNPAAWNADAPQAPDLSTFAVADLDGDGFDDVVVRDPASGAFIVSLAATDDAKSRGVGFKPAAAWLAFAKQTNPNAWNDLTNGATIAAVHIGQPILVGLAPAGTGIVYTRVVAGDAAAGDAPLHFLPGWRHVCNICATTDALATSGWHPERRQYGIAWGALDRSGNDSAVIMRGSGLDVALGQYLAR